MKILFLTHSFNSLAQRLFVELAGRGHEISLELDVNDAVTIEAAELFKPHLIIAPYLRRAIPAAVWKNYVCLVVHPGIKGDRGPSALDWAILNGETEWGITILQANAEMDAGDVWATRTFPMRPASKSSIYRNEVTEAAVSAIWEAAEKFASHRFSPEPLDYRRPEVRGRYHPLMKQTDRAIDWQRDTSEIIVRKIRSADGFPGVLDNVLGVDCYLYNAHEDDSIQGKPGEVVARRNHAICRATIDGGVWISHLRPKPAEEPTFKLPAALVLGERLQGIPDLPEPDDPAVASNGFREIFYHEKDGVGYLHFDFYNGAMSTEQCRRLLDAYRRIKQRNTRVIVLMGGQDFWSNGIHLNVIEAAACPADESLFNIDAMNDFAREVILTERQPTVAALQGNAGAGGVFLAMACDYVWARSGIILNPHYKNMGNLYGSEYWTYLMPKRVGMDKAKQIMSHRLPIGTREALQAGMIDEAFGHDLQDFQNKVEKRATALANDPAWQEKLNLKLERQAFDEAQKPLDRYREEEIERMKLNFYGFDPSYHVARYNFVYKIPHSRTPLHLAVHRRIS
jgi:putative two-component system hydrogenase maturation factor HypX/HoxX